jgi:hypothetical protein
MIERRSIIDEHGRLREGNWGIRELTIAAAYLRQIRLEDLETTIPGPPLLRALVVDDNGSDVDYTRNLCYELFVRRASTALIADVNLFAKAKQQTLRRSGIEVVRTTASYTGEICHPYLLCDAQVDQGPEVDLPVRRIAIRTKRARVLTGTGTPSILRSHLAKALVSANDVGFETWKRIAEAWKEHVYERHGLQDLQLYHSPTVTGRRACGRLAPSAAAALSDEQIRKAVIYDRHGDVALRWQDSEQLKRLLFWEPYNDPDDQCTLFESPPDDENAKQALEAEFLAAAVARIVILDERVQEAVEGSQGVMKGRIHITMRDSVELRRIYVPSRHECDLRHDPTREKIEQFLGDLWQTGSLDFLAIHQGILDRLSPTNSDQSALTWIKGLSSNCAVGCGAVGEFGRSANLVICSGRGVPPEVLNAGIRFIPFSGVLRSIVHKPSKYHLYQLLCASRGRRYA